VDQTALAKDLTPGSEFTQDSTSGVHIPGNTIVKYRLHNHTILLRSWWIKLSGLGTLNGKASVCT
jgi:hypothetical protein